MFVVLGFKVGTPMANDETISKTLAVKFQFVKHKKYIHNMLCNLTYFTIINNR